MDYKLFKEVHQSIKGLFKDGKPLHHLPAAKLRQYTPNASRFFVTTDEELKTMSGQEIQAIFRNRHIIISGTPSGRKFDHTTLRSIGLAQKHQMQGECHAVSQ
jgi:hypothetical protein